MVVVEASVLTFLELPDIGTAAVVDAILDVVVVDAAASILCPMIDLLCSILCGVSVFVTFPFSVSFSFYEIYFDKSRI